MSFCCRGLSEQSTKIKKHVCEFRKQQKNIRAGALFIIKLYQRTLSLDHGPLRRFMSQPRCKFHPTCSQYAYTAIERFGLSKGLPLSIKRLTRCHPWSLGGLDPVPDA